MDYGGFYDLKKLTMKTIQGVQYLGAMNPSAGSFKIIDRMQVCGVVFFSAALPVPQRPTHKQAHPPPHHPTTSPPHHRHQ